MPHSQQIQLGDHTTTTTSSRRELITLIFLLAGKPLPDWTQFAYPGYPVVVQGTPPHARRRIQLRVVAGVQALFDLLFARVRLRFAFLAISNALTAAQRIALVRIRHTLGRFRN